MTRRNSIKGEDLIQIILNTPSGYDGSDGHALLEKIGEGFPIERLELLLQSDNPYARESAVWILVESGMDTVRFLKYLPDLLHDKNFRVRFWTVDYILLNWNFIDKSLKEKCLGLLQDDVAVVREYANKQFKKL